MHAHAQRLTPLIALYVAVAFLGGSFLHNVIPHDHGAHDSCEAIYGYGHCPANGGEEAGLWHFIHEAIAHEDKKGIALAEGSMLLSALALVVLLLSSVAIERLSTDSLDLALMRGRFRYRAFG